MGIFSRVNWALLLGVGILTVGIGAPVAVWQNQSKIEQHLQSQLQTDLNNVGLSWAEVQVSGRDIAVSGLATSTEQIKSADTIISGYELARTATLDAKLAPKLEPFTLVLKTDEKSRSMVGGMPNEELAAQAAQWFGEGQIDLKLASGSPAARDWRDVTQFAIRLLQHFDQGTVAVEGLKVSIDGRAKDHDAYHTLDIVFGAGFPDNLQRGEGAIVAPLVSPFTFAAQKGDDASTQVSGNIISKQQLADIENAGISTEALKISSGEPSGYADALEKLLKALDGLQSGQFEITDETIKVSGQATDFASFDLTSDLSEQLKPFNVAIDLERPIIQPFTIKFEIVEDQISVAGYVPTDKDLDAVTSFSGSESLNNVRVANGAPANFDAAMNLLIETLKHLQVGAVAEIEDHQIMVQGRAISPHDFLALQEKFGNNIPDGYDLAIANIELPEVSPYNWSLSKEPEGRIRLAGYSPSSELSDDIFAILSKNEIIDETLPAVGQPDDFEKITLASAAASNSMVEGQVTLQNNAWSLNAVAKSKDHQNNILQEFSNKQIQLDTWQEAQFTVLSPPEAKPYRFEAKRDQNGDLTFEGYVRNEETQLLLTGLGNSNVSLASGEPEGFEESLNIGLSALQRLETGQFGYDGQQWFLSGVAAHQDVINAIRSDLGDLAIIQDGWRVEIEALISPIVPYLWAAEKPSEGAIVLSGYVPDQTVLDALVETGGQAGDLKIGVGAPEGFAQKANAALRSLELLKAGRASLSGEVWTLIGSAGSDDAISQITELLSPFGSAFRLDLHVVQPIEQLTWSATKTLDQTTAYQGFLANTQVWTEQNSKLQLVSEPPSYQQDFVERTKRGLGALELLSEGETKFDGTGWTLSGTAPDKAVATVVEQMLSGDADPAWQLTIADAQELAKAEAEKQALLELEAEKQAEEKAQAEAAAKAEAEEVAKRDAEAKAEAEAKAQAEAMAAEEAKIEAEKQAQLEMEAKAQAEAEAQALAEANAQALLEAEAKAKADAEEQAKLDAEAKKIAEIANSFSWQATKSNETIALAGNVPDAGVRYSLQLAAGLSETPDLTAAEGAPERFSASAFAGLQALNSLGQGVVSLKNGQWSISGSAKDFATRNTAVAALYEAPTQWQIDISTPPGWVICSEVIADLLKQNTIIFQSGSTNLSETSKQVVADIAEQLNQCPKAIVEVEGHTDADGDDETNLTLSVLRAERVVDELLELGVDATRLFAVGYGETLPIASNDTQSGKQLNRRIVFAVREAVE